MTGWHGLLFDYIASRLGFSNSALSGGFVRWLPSLRISGAPTKKAGDEVGGIRPSSLESKKVALHVAIGTFKTRLARRRP